jgi:hypothetical protein
MSLSLACVEYCLHLGGRIGMRTRRILAIVLPLPKLRIACLMMNISGCLRSAFDYVSFKAKTTVHGSLATNVTNGHTRLIQRKRS